MVHDLDPLVIATSLASREDLASLRRERRRLEGVLRKGPGDVAEALCEAVRQRDAVRTELKAFRLTRDGPQVERLRAERDRLGARIEALRKRYKRRQAFLAKHDDEVQGLRLVRRAELAREAAVRAQARLELSETLATLSGRGPIADRAVADAAEAIAVHGERYGIVTSDSAGPLGLRPEEPEACMSFDRAERLLRAAEDSPVEVIRPEPAFTLFD
jgi:hypothetical protein